MLAQARAESPNECCGLLAGFVPGGEAGADKGSGLPTNGPRVARVVQRYPLVNAAKSPKEYNADTRSLLEAVKDMRRLGLDILAIYHSHPLTDPVPSATDLERAYGPDVINFIISLKSDPPVVRGWWLSATVYREAEWECIA
jgi:proteasome lid subunit RPN8/RPN11